MVINNLLFNFIIILCIIYLFQERKNSMKDIHDISKKYYSSAIELLKKWIKIDSTYDESTSSKNHPFGLGVAKALKYIADIARKDGFEVDECDGYCTEISYGEGPLIAIYAHCDVVPVSGEWKFPPFSATVEDDIMYGRGTSDDKGPVMAAYHALKLLKDEHLIKNYRVSLVIGGNEESGSKCLEYYFDHLHKPYPAYGFTPDGDFPLIYGEKAIATFSGSIDKVFDKIESLDAGVVINSVIDKADVKLNATIDVKHLENYCINHGLKFNYKDNNLTFYGKAAHGSLPQLGINAGLHLLIFLGQEFNYPELVNIGEGYLDGEGHALGVYYESKLLHETTYNVGLISYKDGHLQYRVNFRYPENVDVDKVIEKLNQMNVGIITFEGTSSYLLFDPESPMIKTLMRCYQEETGDYDSKPMAIGGGTYAKESKNTVAFGSHFVGREDHIHDCNEKIHLDDLRASISIYAKAINELGLLAGVSK